MLALMPRSSLLLDPHMPNSALESRTLPFLPSTPMTYTQPPLCAGLSSPPSKKPKLTLNTSSTSPVFGKGVTSLTLETLSATSPTARNTFQNRKAGEGDLEARSQKPVLTPIQTSVQSPSPSQISLPDSADSTDLSDSLDVSEASSVSSVDSSPVEAPYKLPFNAASILTNGPIPRTKHGRHSFSQSRPMFPAPKKVGFRLQLTEEIETRKYTLRHSDIGSTPPPTTAEEADAKDDATVTSPTSSLKRDSDHVDEVGDIHLATPVAGRAKRHRWVWTLPPVQSAAQQSSSSAVETDETMSC